MSETNKTITRGVGVDITSIERIKKLKQAVLDRIFTAKEQEYCKKMKKCETRFAGRFAAKEAVAKSFGTGFAQGISFQDIEILPNSLGAPQVELSGKAKELFPNHIVLLSISHDAGLAIASASLEELIEN
jgi:holo-[acyl-carrier protein] synthase